MAPIQTLVAASSRFEAARQLAALPDEHRCRALHGHGFVATVLAALPEGWAPWPGGEVAALQARLRQCTAPLDYGLLNAHLPEPGDEQLARWLGDRLDLPGRVRVAVQSTADQGAAVDSDGRGHAWRRYRFLAAHRLPHVPAGHKCGRMHGHGFQAIVHARGSMGTPHPAQAGAYDRLDALWAPLASQLDHRCLNEIPGLSNPTSEMLSSWLWQRLVPALPGLAGIGVYETASCGATFDGQRYRIWKDFTLDSAVRLRQAPAGDPRQRLHGHTFTLRLHLSAPLDTVMGWTVDFGDVKAVFDPVFRTLDHHPLHEQPGLEDGDTVTIARWIHDRARQMLPQLVRVDLYESDGCGVVVGSDLAGPALPADA